MLITIYSICNTLLQKINVLYTLQMCIIYHVKLLPTVEICIKNLSVTHNSIQLDKTVFYSIVSSQCQEKSHTKMKYV